MMRLGLGEVNWGKFLSVPGDAGYQGAVCVEVEDRAYEGGLKARKHDVAHKFHFETFEHPIP